ncbi:hypothetical protein FHG87_001057 [Trinorchestia longiramus]|nr:hypothetical protein FHG87_001057 [Trinorchestia longiramus]
MQLRVRGGARRRSQAASARRNKRLRWLPVVVSCGKKFALAIRASLLKTPEMALQFPQLLVLLLTVAAVVECDPIFFLKKNSRESDRSRERTSLSSFKTSVDDSNENVGGKSFTNVHAFHENPLPTSRLNFEHDIIIGKPVVPIETAGELSKVGNTIRLLDTDSNFKDTDDFDKIDEILLNDERLTTQKETKQLGRLASQRDTQATLLLEAHNNDSIEHKNHRSQGTDISEETVEKEDDDLEISYERNRSPNQGKIFSSFGRLLNFPPTFSSAQPVKISVSRKSSVSSVVDGIAPPGSHHKGNDQKKNMSAHSHFSSTSRRKDGKKIGQHDDDDVSASTVKLGKNITSRGRRVKPVGFSYGNQVKKIQNTHSEANERSLEIRAGTRTVGQNHGRSKSKSEAADKVSTEILQEIFGVKNSMEILRNVNFRVRDLIDSFEDSNEDTRVGKFDLTDSDHSDEIFIRKIKINDNINYNSPELDESDERSSKFKFPVLPKIVLPKPSSQTKGIEDISLESNELHIKPLKAHRIPDPNSKYVPPVYIPTSQRQTPPFKSSRPSSPLHSSSYPNLSSFRFTLDDSEESEIKSLKPVHSLHNTHLPLAPQLTPEAIKIESDEIKDFRLYQPHKPRPLLNSKRQNSQSEELVTKPVSESYLPLKSQQQFNSDELEIESDEYVVTKHVTHGTTTSYLPSSPLEYGSRFKNYSPLSPEKTHLSKNNSPLSSSHTLNLKYESDEKSIESVLDTHLFSDAPHVSSHFPTKIVKPATTFQSQKYSPPASNAISSSSQEYESDEIKIDSDEATLKVIPAVRITSTYNPPSLKYKSPPQITATSPLESTSSFRESSLSTLNSSPLVQNHALLSNTYKSPKQVAALHQQPRYSPLRQYSAPLLMKQQLVSRPTVSSPHHQNLHQIKIKAHPPKAVQNHRIVHNKLALTPIVSQQKYTAPVQPKPIQGLLLQPQQPMRYGGQFTQYVPQKARVFNALLITPLNNGKDLNSRRQKNYFRGIYGLQQTNVPLPTVRQPIWTRPATQRPNVNAGLLNKKKNLYSASSSLPMSSGFVNLGSAGVPLPNQQPIKTFSSFSTDSDETIIQKTVPVSPIISPNYGAPVEVSYQAPQQSYEAPAVCEPVVQYSVVTHDVLVPTTVEVYRTKYLPTTQYNQVIETKYYAKPQVNVVTVTSVIEPQIVTKTQVATNPVYVAQTQYETVTKYLTATQANIVTDTHVLYKTRYDTVTDVQYRTQTEIQYQTKTKYRTQYQTHTEINYQTKIEYQTQYLTSTAISKVPVYNTVTETKVKKQYVTETVPEYRTKTATQQQFVTETVTSQYPFYTTVVSTHYHPQYVTVTVTQPCSQGYGFY